MSQSAEIFLGEPFNVSLISGVVKIFASESYVTILFPNIFVSQCRKKFEEEPFCVSKKFWYRKVSSKEGGSFSVLSKIFFSHRTKKNSSGNHSVSQKNSAREKFFIDKRVGGITISVDVLVSLYGKISLENTLVFQKKSSFGYFHALARGGASRFCQIFLSLSTETKSFVKELFCFPETFWFRKRIMDNRGPITIFSRNFYVSQCRKLS